jgi:hypothetical protein
MYKQALFWAKQEETIAVLIISQAQSNSLCFYISGVKANNTMNAVGTPQMKVKT